MFRKVNRTIIMGILIILIAASCTTAFNLEPKLAVVKKGDSDSYFGYSVAQHLIVKEDSRNRASEPVLLIGAPRAQTSQPGTNRSGAVYRCPLSTIFKDCHQLPIENDDSPPDITVDKDDQWLGVTVKSQGAGRYVMTCAHRHVIKGDNFRWGQGICYSLSQTLDFDKTWTACMNRPVGKAHEQFGYCQSGTSGEISEDNDIIIGTPGAYTWRGTVFLNNVRFGIRDDKTWYMGPLLDEDSPVDKYSYLGMSVTSGKFFGDVMSYVGGAPRANGTGQVVFFSKQGDSTLNVQLVLSGEQIASSYGYSLTSLDINGDKLPDLVVGAPFYYTRNAGGAVYIYVNSKDYLNENSVPLKLTGKPESRFGFALSSTGDINRDGYTDLAIGAPYEENGVVYIYLGSEKGLLKEPSQVIRASDLPREALSRARMMKTFGYSLSGGMDMDGNGYPDLLVGAYESDAAALLRTRPIINIVTSVDGELENINPHKQGCDGDPSAALVCFTFRACFQFNSTIYLRLKYKIEAETFTSKKYYRVKFNSSLTTDDQNIVEKELYIDRNAPLHHPQCSSELVYLKDKSDIQNPIKFQLTYQLMLKEPKMPKEGDTLPSLRAFPILNQQEARRIFEAKFLKDCGENEICESDLHITADLNLTRENGVPKLSLGEGSINMTVRVVNKKEPAYDAKLYIIYPINVGFIGRKVVVGDGVECIPKVVENSNPVVICDLGNPFVGEVELLVRFNPKGVDDDTNVLRFELKTNTTSEEVHKNDTILEASIIRVADLDVIGASSPEQVFYGGELVGENMVKYEDQVGLPLMHKYAVKNRGPWKVRRANVTISWPYEVENKKEHGKWLLYMIEQPIVQGNGFCSLPPGRVNPNNLLHRPSEDVAEKKNFTNEYHRLRRRKREVVIIPEEVRMEGKTHKVVVMDCHKGTAKCFTFNCSLFDLQEDQTTVIRIRARLWNSTFVEDYPSVDWVIIYSHAEVSIDPALKITQPSVDNDKASVATKAYPDIPLYQKPQDVPLWIIILAVCGGIFVLLIVILILWKLGFFKRKKPEYELAPTEDKEKNNSY